MRQFVPPYDEWGAMTAVLSGARVTSIETKSHWSKIALSGLNYEMTNLWHGIFILWVPLLSQWKVLLKDQRSCLYSWQSENLLLGYLPRHSQLLQTRNHLCLSVQCEVVFLQMGFRTLWWWWCTWATVMAHFFASSSLASSLGYGLLRCE